MRYRRLLKQYKLAPVVATADLAVEDTSLRLYVLVDDSLLPRGGAKSAQVTHAVVELMKRHYPQNVRVKTWAETDLTLVILAAGREEMERHRARFNEDGYIAEGFVEPDLGNVLTCVAFEPLTALEGMIFGHLKLAR
jgi:peptidyl-tRNA hydrolase